jgi:hypothetical protein
MEWQVRKFPWAVGDTVLLGPWEPFAWTGQYILAKREVIVEDEEKSSVHHQLTFGERYER